MSPFRYRDDTSTRNAIIGVLAGAVAGLAVGMVLSDRLGGLSGIRARLRRPEESERARYYAGHGVAEDFDEALDEDLGDYEEDDFDTDEEYDYESVEERVLEAFRNDPTLAERAIDIGELRDGVIELAGWVNTEREAQHAVTIARGVPGVDTVVNRILIGDEERQL